MSKNTRLFLPLLGTLLCFAAFVPAQSDIYDRIGLLPEHGFEGAVPGENVDLFTGNHTLQYLDLDLPGPNGLDLQIRRVYNSKIVYDVRLPDPNAGGWETGYVFQGEPRSWLGLGWTMHMGRLRNYNLSGNPVIEFPDGRRESTYLTKEEGGVATYMTRDFLKLERNSFGWFLYFQDGTKWKFGLSRKVLYEKGLEEVMLVTEISNNYGDRITITYAGESATIDTITDAVGRQVEFELAAGSDPLYPRLARMKLLYGGSLVRSFDYTVEAEPDPNPIGQVHLLKRFQPPAPLAAEEFTYYLNTFPDKCRYQLQKATTSFGGSAEYHYVDHKFAEPVSDGKLTRYGSRVLDWKKIDFGSGEVATWTYNYPLYDGADTTATVNGPLFSSTVKYWAGSDLPAAGDVYKAGLIQEKRLQDGSLVEGYDWTYYETLDVNPLNPGPVRLPLRAEVKRTTSPSMVVREQYTYGGDPKQYGLPSSIVYSSGCGSDSAKRTTSITYAFESRSDFKNNYMLSYVSNERITAAAGGLLKETATTYESNGAVDRIERTVDGSRKLVWDYTHSQSGDQVTIDVDLPGAAAGTETRVYQHGVLAKVKKPGYLELSRVISAGDASITSETNQHGGTMGFLYDGIGRIEHVNMPVGFDDIDAEWGTRTVSIRRGTGAITRYWDGIGRDLGSEESGDGVTLHSRKTLDAEGRVTSESRAAASAGQTFNFTYQNSGGLLTTTDPEGITTLNRSFSGCDELVLDGKSNQWQYRYEEQPGLITRVTDPAGNLATHQYDPLGRLVRADYGDRVQTWAYNMFDQVTEESHPETGKIIYGYDAATGNLSSKSWGGKVTSFSYNESNQLNGLSAEAESITYGFDAKGRVSSADSSAGWRRDGITYNSLGSVTNETIVIPGLASKSIGYDYDGSNLPSGVTYPDGKKATGTNNGLDALETLSLDGTALISGVQYSFGKQPKQIDFGNGTVFGAGYDLAGHLKSAKLSRSGGRLYNADYSFDRNYNIDAINNTVTGIDATFQYDALNRLVHASYGPGAARAKLFDYQIDKYGNLDRADEDGRTVFGKTFTSANRITGFAYDARGNLVSDGVYVYLWDALNRLEEVQKAANGDLLAEYSYDDRGLRLKSSRSTATSGGEIVVVSPNGGELWYMGDSQAITWQAAAGITRVGITLEYTLPDGQPGHYDISPAAGVDAASGSYPWVVANLRGCGFVVRISNLDGAQTDVSDAPFSITKGPSTITVLYPGAAGSSDVLEIGNTYSINWKLEGNFVGEGLKIEYTTEGDKASPVYNLIRLQSSYSPPCSWNVKGPPSSKCLVRITDRDGSPVGVSASFFSIVGPALEVTQPATGDRWQVSTEHNIKWTATGDFKDMKLWIEYWSKAANGWTTIAGNLNPSAGVYLWKIPDDVTESSQIWIHTGTGTVEAKSGTFAIVPLARKITVVFPNGDENGDPIGAPLQLKAGELRNIQIAYDSIGYGNGVMVSLVVAGQARWTQEVYGYKTTIPWVVDDLASSQCKIMVRDMNSAAQDESDFNFIIRESPPTLTLNRPTGGETLSAWQQNPIEWTSTKASLVPQVEIQRGPPLASHEIDWKTIATVANVEGKNTYQWTPTEGGEGRIRISDPRDRDPYVISGRITVVEEPSVIVVDVPNGTMHNMVVGTKRYIKWTRTGPNQPARVVIKLTRTGRMADAVKIHDTATVENTGEFAWVVTEPPADHCLIWIGDSDGTPSDVSDNEFRILKDIVVQKPQAGEYEMGSMMEIRWTPTNWPANVKVDLKRGDGAAWESLTAPDSSIANVGRMTWKVTGPKADGCTIRVSDAKDGNPFGISAKFSIVPAITVDWPNGGEQLTIDAYAKLKWTTRGAVPEVRLELSRNGGTSWELIAGKVPNDGLYAWKVKGPKSTACLLRVSDLDGKPTDTSDGTFAIKAALTMALQQQAAPETLGRPQLPPTLPCNDRRWVKDLPPGTTFFKGTRGLADRLVVMPEDDGEYVGTEEDFEKQFGGEDEPEKDDSDDRPAPKNDTTSRNRTQTLTLPGAPVAPAAAVTTGAEVTYYIHSFDGKLLAEYDADGTPTRDYIYAGNRLVAEWRPKETDTSKQLYFYTPDQINSTRFITDSSGNGKYEATFDPYGGIQKESATDYQPALKFSGKEREISTGLDYFGARWYANAQRRWISVDPVMNRDAAMRNPQLWNLYGYCRNNPVTFLDTDGREVALASGMKKDERDFTVKAMVGLVQRPSGRSAFKTMTTAKEKVVVGVGSLNSPAKITMGKKSGKPFEVTFGTTTAVHPVKNEIAMTLDRRVITDKSLGTSGHIDSGGITTIAHEMYHAKAALERNDALLRSGDEPSSQTGPAQVFGEGVYSETPDISTEEAERLVDEALNGSPAQSQPATR